MTDKFENFESLANAHHEGIDYRVCARPIDGCRLLVIAPHGGKIEKGTSELACAIAGSDHSLYLFEGLMQRNNGHLHITSHNFDEPRALGMVSNCQTAIGIHGRQDAGDATCIYIGGLDGHLKSHISTSLQEAGYATRLEGHKFLAKHPRNICNQGKNKKGAQIELPKTLRDHLLKDEAELRKMSNAMRAAIAAYFSS